MNDDKVLSFNSRHTVDNQLGEAATAEELQQKYIEAAASDYDDD